uniref:Uncharacterized protein n=1 Tax=Oryza glumipatula TaxID=40148 RepID=A0A0D9ZH54_9ORYZ
MVGRKGKTERQRMSCRAKEVTKTVYASQSRVNFHLDRRKAVETVPAYPNICFSVDDFDDTFDAVVLSDPEHCYCVILNAHDGAAFPENTESKNPSSNVLSGATSATKTFEKLMMAILYPPDLDTVGRRCDRQCRDRRRRMNNQSCGDSNAAVTSPSPAPVLVVMASPRRATKKMAKATSAIVARKAENGIEHGVKERRREEPRGRVCVREREERRFHRREGEAIFRRRREGHFAAPSAAPERQAGAEVFVDGDSSSEGEKREIQKGERKLTFSPRQGGGNEVGILAVDAVSPVKCRFLAPVFSGSRRFDGGIYGLNVFLPAIIFLSVAEAAPYYWNSLSSTIGGIDYMDLNCKIQKKKTMKKKNQKIKSEENDDYMDLSLLV